MKFIKIILCFALLAVVSCNKETSDGITDVNMSVVDRSETSLEILVQKIWVLTA